MPKTPRLQSFAPIVDNAARGLILGTMPGKVSLEKSEYYGHPQNSFWRIIFRLCGTDFSDDYETKKRLLSEHRIALWDVLQYCNREGSMDADIEAEHPNDFTAFFKNYPDIRTVCFNGNNAQHFFKKHVGFRTGFHYCRLPSTSPAYARLSFEGKYEKWKIIQSLIGE